MKSKLSLMVNLNQQIKRASKKGDILEIKRLFTDPKIPSYVYDLLIEEGSCLFDSIIHGDLNVIDFMLTSKEMPSNFNIHLRNDNLLNVAAWHGHLHVVEYLLTSPKLGSHCNIHAQNNRALTSAITQGHLQVVKYLLNSPKIKEKAILNFEDFFILNIIQFLLTDSKLKNIFSIEQLNTLLESSVKNKKIDILEYLLTSPELDHNFDVNYSKDKLLKVACKNECYEMINFLLESPKIKQHSNVYLIKKSHCHPNVWNWIVKYKIDVEIEKLSLKKSKTTKKINIL